MTTWMHEHGISSSYNDFLDLPLSVVEDCELLMAFDAEERERTAHG